METIEDIKKIKLIEDCYQEIKKSGNKIIEIEKECPDYNEDDEDFTPPTGAKGLYRRFLLMENDKLQNKLFDLMEDFLITRKTEQWKLKNGKFMKADAAEL